MFTAGVGGFLTGTTSNARGSTPKHNGFLELLFTSRPDSRLTLPYPITLYRLTPLGSLTPLSVNTPVPGRVQLSHDCSIASFPPNQLSILPPAFAAIYPIQHSWFTGRLSTIFFLLSIA